VRGARPFVCDGEPNHLGVFRDCTLERQDPLKQGRDMKRGRTDWRACLLVLATSAILGPATHAAEAPTLETVGPFPPAPADAQILLDRLNFSPGMIDNRWGVNSLKAVAAFQKAQGRSVSGRLDRGTSNSLVAAGGEQVVATYTITLEDEKGPFYKIPDDIEEEAKLSALGYSSLLEMLGERFHCSERFLHQLNPGAPFVAGAVIRVPNVRNVTEGVTRSRSGTASLQITVSKSKHELKVEDGGRLLFFAPVSAGSEHDPLPLGTWKVRSFVRDPVFHYDPELFWNADPSRAKTTLQPGPNNPVGRVWIDLSREHYGIHGTPTPSEIGRSFSHGCVRLTNWDALTVAGLVSKDTPVIFVP
jgi:lipoprotein-anchoring transpeptidase ErfK/SrfK